jgi:CelD/BcsL family acetyltransferase involved in cellulose biosynthesis
MDVELVATTDLDSAWRDWERLFRADVLATPFNSPGWGRAWLEHWDAAAKPWLMRVHDGTRVAGIAPLALLRDRGIRLLTMVGKEPGDYWDLISAPQDRQAAATAVGVELARLSHLWDAGILSCFPPGSQTLDAFASAGLRVFRRAPLASPAIELPRTFEEYLAALPANRRQNIRRHLRRLDSGEVRLRRVDDPGALGEVMGRWRDLRSRQWQAAGRPMTAEHQQERFHRFMLAAASHLVNAGMAVVWELSCSDRVAGVYVNFADARSFYWYLGGFDPEFTRLGLGKIAIAASIRDSIAAGRHLYDFTRGEDAYKYWYGAVDRPLASVVIGHPGTRSRFALAAARLLSAYSSHRVRIRARAASADRDA